MRSVHSDKYLMGRATDEIGLAVTATTFSTRARRLARIRTIHPTSSVVLREAVRALAAKAYGGSFNFFLGAVLAVNPTDLAAMEHTLNQETES